MTPGDTIPWRVRRTARWMSLSLAARGAVEGIVAAMGGQREMQLPTSGLRSLAHLLGRPWTEVEPALMEALEVGKLEYDEERRVIVDPSRDDVFAVRRQELADAFSGLRSRQPTPPPPPPPAPPTGRTLSQSKAALRARAWRALKKASTGASMLPIDAVARCGQQLELPTVRGAFARTLANAPNACDVTLTADSGVISGDSQAFANGSRTDASLSGSSNTSSKKQRGTRVRIEASASMPLGWLERARDLRPDLPAENITEAWTKFAKWNAARTFSSWQAVAVPWESWVKRERLSAPAAPSTPRREASTSNVSAAPYFRPPTLARPDVEPASPSSGPKIVKVTPRAPEEIAAAQRLAMGDWP